MGTVANGAVELSQAKSYLIEQDWEAYTPEQHAVWAELVGRRLPQLEEHASAAYLLSLIHI